MKEREVQKKDESESGLDYHHQDREDHHHLHSDLSTARIIWAVVINIGITAVELIAGILTGSLALLSDAVHNFSDVLVLGVTYLGARVAGGKPDKHHTFGFGRAEVLAGLINAAALVVITLFLVYKAFQRLLDPQPVQGTIVLAVGFVGLLGNVASVLVLTLKRKEKSLSINLRSAVLHLLLDALSAIGVMIAAGVIILTGWQYADPVAAAVIAVLVFVGSVRLLREAIEILMEKAPSGLCVNRINEALMEIEGISEVHDLHVWSVSSTSRIMSAHFVTDPAASRSPEDIVIEARKVLAKRFSILHCTLQPERTGCSKSEIDPL